MTTLPPNMPTQPPAGDGWICCWATTFSDHEVAAKGLHGNFTMLPTDLGAALPHPSARGRVLDLFNPANSRSAGATVLDVGPWEITDCYWLERPCIPIATKKYLAYKEGNGEYAKDFKGRLVVSPAGLDLSPAVWEALGIPHDVAYGGNHSGWVWWRFSILNAAPTPNAPPQ